MRSTLSFVVVVVMAAASAAQASRPGDPFVAVRATGPVHVDGRIDEPAWERAPVYDGFVELFPDEAAAPSERTEVKVLFDDRRLYVAIHCLDSDPPAVDRTLGRRDNAPYSDSVMVAIDSMHEGRTAYRFTVSAGGVQGDGLYYDDDQVTNEWDAVWDGAAAPTPDGWSAELMIPLATLRFSEAPSQTWGFGVDRIIARTHQELASVLIRRAQRGVVSRFGELHGLEGLAPTTALQVTPYFAARVGVRPQYSDSWNATPRLVEPNADFGADLRASLGRGLALQATLNPDFGQVEADEIIQNLSRFEVFFPEKRPFFLEGMDLFQPVAGGSGSRESPQRLFYSRRIGLDAPIFGAAKLTGDVGGELQVGVVEALVTGAAWPGGFTEDSPPDGARFEPAQPLHVAPESAYPALDPATRNFLVGVARWQPTATATFGLTATSALLTDGRCAPDEAVRTDDPTAVDRPEQLRPRRCEAPAGNAVAADWSLRSADGDWFFRGQTTGSQWLGAAPLRALADGTVLRRGDLGYGAYASAGKQGGEPWRFEAQWQYESPELELDAVGYQRTQNEQLGRAILHFVRPNGAGPFHWLDLQTGVETHWTTDGTGLDRGNQVWLGSDFQLRSFHSFGCFGFLDTHAWDVREIDRSGVYGGPEAGSVPGPGVAYRRPGGYAAHCWFSSDPSGPLQLGVEGSAGRTLPLDGLAPVTWWDGELGVVWRPHARAETRLALKYEENRYRARWVDDLGADAYLFADLHAPTLSATLRQQLVMTPRLTLQAYAQLFAGYGEYGPFYSGTATGGTLAASALQSAPTRDGSYDFRGVALNVNLVLRWEYRLGSTLYLVYTREQSELGYEDGSAPATLRPHALGRGPTAEVFMVKWSYWWSR